MKRTILSIIIGGLALSVLGQDTPDADSTGLPGDHFSLEGALEMFKKAPDLQQFEALLNTADNHVNNLDLDGDGEVDYVRVESQKDGDAVVVVMRVPIGKEESQDVAVIELEKTGDETAVLQIRGDEDLYPAGTIVEPFEEKEEAAPGKGPSAPGLAVVRVTVNVWGWACARWCFSPGFVVWVSPWYWGNYPFWWRPWHPYHWHAWWGWCHPYHHWYRHWNACRVTHAHAIYAPRRVHSAVVAHRYQAAHDRYRSQQPAHQVAPGTHKTGTMNRGTRQPPAKAAPKSGGQRGGGQAGHGTRSGGRKGR